MKKRNELLTDKKMIKVAVFVSRVMLLGLLFSLVRWIVILFII
jgi:hypothetical protein